MLKKALLGSMLLCWTAFAFAQANGKLQIHFMDVGQGDSAVLVSPLGEIVLFDDGQSKDCDKPLSYLQQLGVTKIDYNVVSHYHDDHIGCTAQILTEFPLQKDAFDRGSNKQNPAFKKYVAAAGDHRKTVTPGMKVTLDAGSPNPVEVTFVALNGNGVKTTNENDLSVVAVIRFGDFDAEIGGDLSGFKTSSYDDIETSVAPKVGQIEVYKVHHHCSKYSTNDNWLSAAKPKVAIVSVGDGNTFKHPTEACLDRLRNAGVRTYWTETGNGALPVAGDVIAGNIIVEVEPASKKFTVTYGTFTDSYSDWASPDPPVIGRPEFAWSKASNVYHYANCRYVSNISAANLERGSTPPDGKTLHKGCLK